MYIVKNSVYIASAVVIVLLPLLAFGATFHAGQEYSLATGETITDDAYIASGSNAISGAVQGDLFAVGRNTLITGNVSQDLNAAGGSLNILGNVGDDARVVGGNLTIGGAVTDDLLAAGGSIHLLSSGQVDGDVTMVGGDITIDGPVRCNVKITGGTITLNSTIAGDVALQGKKIILGEKAVLEKNLTYKSSKEAEVRSGAVVRGTTDFQKREARHMKASWRAFIGFWVVVKFLMLLAAALIVGLVFRRTTAAVLERSREAFWMELLRGFVVLVATPIALIILGVTLIGIPIAAFGLAFFVFLLLLTYAYSPVIAGSLLARYLRPQARLDWLTILIGVLAFVILDFIPIIGWIIESIIFLAALGVLARETRDRLWPLR